MITPVENRPTSSLAIALVDQSFAVVRNPVPRGDYVQLSHTFRNVIGNVGANKLTELTQRQTSGRTGGLAGYVEKKIPQKDGTVALKQSFFFRTRPDEYTPDYVEMDLDTATEIKDLIAQGLEIMHATAFAMHMHVVELDKAFPQVGFLKAHYDKWRNGTVRQNFTSRLLRYSQDTGEGKQKAKTVPSEREVSTAHLDLGSISLHGFSSEPNTIYFIPYKEGTTPTVYRPIIREDEAILFPGVRLIVDGRKQSFSTDAVVCPDAPFPIPWHVAFSRENERTVFTSELHPKLGIHLHPRHGNENYGDRETPHKVLEAIEQTVW